VTTESLDSADLDRILERVPLIAGIPRQVHELSGGLTNRNYKVTTADGAYVVRRSPAGTDLLSINRDHEHRNSVAAARSGVGAEVVAYLPDEAVLVVRFIDGETFTDSHFARPGTIARVARACRRLHDGERFVNDFDMFAVQRDYLDVVRNHGFRLPDRYLDYRPQVEQIHRALAVRNEGTVPCNNDLLAANFIDDGDKIRIIDYEYAGNNDACFELGNIWSECHLDLDQLAELLSSYYGRGSRNKLARAQLLGLMSRYGWTLWASIQQASSAMDFDFWSWGMEKYDAAEAMFRGGDFERLLGDVQRAD
jgi:thiamine kinase-like enzyme